MKSLVQAALAFAVNSNIGRGLVLVSLVTLLTCLLRGFLTLLPGDVAGTMLHAFVWGTLGITTMFYVSLRTFGKVRIYMGTGADLGRVFALMPTAQRPPRPPIWAFGSHMQFMPWVVYNVLSSALVPLHYQIQTLRVFGLVDKTKPESKTNPRSMDDDVVISYFPPLEAEDAPQEYRLALDAPAILVDGGLTCTAQDVPGSSLLRLAVLRGFRVVVVERRGHALPLKKPRWNLFGDSDDLEQIVKAVRDKLPGAPFFWVGISSGSKLPIEAMGKFDQRRKNGDTTAPQFVATACLSPGYNLETCFMGFAFPYKYLCRSSVRSKFLLENEEVLRSYNPDAYEKAVQAPDLQSLLYHSAPFAGYPSAEEYFAVENPVLFAPLITTPTLIINSMDDPLCVVQNCYGKMPGHEDGLTFVEMVEKSPCGLLLITPSGSHCPFLDGTFWPFVSVPQALGRLVIASWADYCILEFFEGYLTEHKAFGRKME